MQNYTPVSDSSTKSFQSFNSNSIENDTSFNSEVNISISENGNILDQFQNDLNFYNGNSETQTNFSVYSNNDKYLTDFNNNYTSQVLDEVSQTSTCSSKFDESVTSNKNLNKNSLSQVNSNQKNNDEDAKNIKTFASSCSKAKRNESIAKLYEMSQDPDRKPFLDKLLNFNEKRGCTMAVCPSIAKNMIDLHRVYNLVKEKGGFVQVSKKSLWKEIATTCNFPITSTTAYSLRKQYIKHLLHFECKFDRNDADPQVLIQQTDIKSKRKRQTNSNSNNNQQEPQQQIYLQQKQNPVYNKIVPVQIQQNTNIKPIYGQVIFNNYEQQPNQLMQASNEIFLEENQINNNQIIQNDQIINFEQTNNMYQNQQVINQECIKNDFNNNVQFYNQFQQENDNQLKNFSYNQQIPKQQPQYYPEYNQQINYNYNYNYNEQVPNYNYQDNNYNESLRLNNRDQFEQFSPKTYHFNSNYDYTNQNTHRINNPQVNYQVVQNLQNHKIHPHYLNDNIYLEQNKNLENWQVNNFQNNWNNNLNIQNMNQQKVLVNESPIVDRSNNYQKSQQSFSPNLKNQQQVTYYANLNSKLMQPHNYNLLNHSNNNLNASQMTTNQLSYAKNFLAREIEFPSDCIESVKPDLTSIKKLTAKDIQNFDISKLMMSLKSGLLAESTWALNILSILSSDETSYSQFKLSKYPGLVSILVEYFKHYLTELFPEIFKNQLTQKNKDEKNSQESTETEESFILTSLFSKNSSNEDLFNNINNDFQTVGKRNFLEDFENEAEVIELDPLCTISQYKETVHQKCICLSNLIRNISFVNGNQHDLSSESDLILIVSKILLYSHKHNEKKTKVSCFNEEIKESSNDSINKTENSMEEKKDNSEQDFTKESWWWEAINFIQENALVTLTNISAYLDFSNYSEELSLPILEGLLHWALCPSSAALDNYASTSIKSCSPKRLALECLIKLSIYESNVDLILSTPPLNRNLNAFTQLTNLLSKCEQQIVREFALILLFNFVISDSGVARAISISSNIVNHLINYLEQYESSLWQNRKNLNYTPNNELNFTTTLDMASKAASCLSCLASVPENRSQFFRNQQRLIQLVTSSVLDPHLSKTIADVIYKCSEN